MTEHGGTIDGGTWKDFEVEFQLICMLARISSMGAIILPWEIHFHACTFVWQDLCMFASDFNIIMHSIKSKRFRFKR